MSTTQMNYYMNIGYERNIVTIANVKYFVFSLGRLEYKIKIK